MKTFYKKINGVPMYKAQNTIIIIKDDMQIISPTEEQLLEDGWEVYEPKAIEPTEEELLKMKKENLKDRINRYDTSDKVNQFYVKGIPVWLDKATRAGLLLRFQAEQATGVEDTALWYNGLQFPLKVTDAIAMLYAIEMYASACYDNTQRHLAAVGALTTIEEVEAYDYQTGYPEKLKF